MTTPWQPGASLDMLAARAGLLRHLRSFMERRGMLEVDTPLLSHAAVTDPNLRSFHVTYHNPAGAEKTLFLATSPEYAMKRLLAHGSGPIYQITHVFRDAEAGRLHNPEFAMLEWYRPGFDEHALMSEISDLLQELGFAAPLKKKYAEVFHAATGLDAHRVDGTALETAARMWGLAGAGQERSLVLDFLFNRCVAEGLGREQPVFIHDYPACHCALARLSNESPPVARRFELFIHGVEIANGFYELTEAKEQRRRFVADNLTRRRRNLPELPVDEHLLQALAHGMPDCAGAALGIDRLLMVREGCDDLRRVLPFSIDHA